MKVSGVLGLAPTIRGGGDDDDDDDDDEGNEGRRGELASLDGNRVSASAVAVVVIASATTMFVTGTRCWCRRQLHEAAWC
mmetsp:Transcript_25656/g.71726  ORF Transcript_25656/g.71726 Transcript_25656/m.71726 type:complete len:80 (+) Transcript_25656:800-1039(+)